MPRIVVILLLLFSLNLKSQQNSTTAIDISHFVGIGEFEGWEIPYFDIGIFQLLHETKSLKFGLVANYATLRSNGLLNSIREVNFYSGRVFVGYCENKEEKIVPYLSFGIGKGYEQTSLVINFATRFKLLSWMDAIVQFDVYSPNTFSKEQYLTETTLIKAGVGFRL